MTGKNPQQKNQVMHQDSPVLDSPQPDIPTSTARIILFFFLAVTVVLAIVVPSNAAQETVNLSTVETNNRLSPAYGVDFITAAEGHADEQQFANAQATGAGWDRWPIYWFYIETSEGVFDWSRQDKAVQDDLAHGFQLNAILLGTPAFYTTSFLQQPSLPYRHPPRKGTLSLDAIEKATPQGLYEPVFLDGDAPGANKVINSQNKWAVFVEKAVNRYKPGGVLAQANDWPEGTGVKLWEMWNEPDLPFFWDASLEDYARLLKVGYLAAKHADSEAQIMFAGLAMFSIPTYYDQVLDIYDEDSLAKSQSYFHDVAAMHNYFVSERTGIYAEILSDAMTDHDLDKSIWVNESGVAAWDDYPGPVWEPLSPLRATQQEQADFAIQSAFHGLSAGADGLFHFQLYDGCGNQPAGTDFPPHDGELCDEDNNYNGKPCAGDANGLYRNPDDAACFTQHPQAETPRPVFAAYKVLTSYIRDIEPYWEERAGTPIDSSTCSGSDGPQELIALYQPSTNKRIVGMWARCERTETAVIKATDPDGKAQLVASDGSIQELTAVDGAYTITLPRATHRNPFPGQTINPTFPIGGRPFILIETDFRGDLSTVTPTPTNTPGPSPTATDTPTATTTPTCNQVIINGGFENDDGWKFSNTPYPARYSTAMAYSGSRSLQAGIIDPQDNQISYSTALQTITVPSTPEDQMLHVQLYTVSSESTVLRLPADPLIMTGDSAAGDSDRQMVLLLDLNNEVIETLFIDRLNDESWEAYSFDLADFAGDSVKLYFGVSNNGEDGATGMFVDDVMLGSCDDPPPTPTSTPTATPRPDLPFKSYVPLLINGNP